MELEPKQALPVGPPWAPCASREQTVERMHEPVTVQVLGQAQQLGTRRAAALLAPALVPHIALLPLLDLATGHAGAVVGPQAVVLLEEGACTGALVGAGRGAWPGRRQGLVEGDAALTSKPPAMALSLSATKLKVKLPAASAARSKLASYARSFPPASMKFGLGTTALLTLDCHRLCMNAYRTYITRV